MPLYVYRCPAEHETELLRPRDVAVVACACGAAAGRVSVNRIGMSGFAIVPKEHRTYRQQYREFTEARAEVGDAYQRRWDAGEPVQMPDYAGIAAHNVKAKGG